MVRGRKILFPILSNNTPSQSSPKDPLRLYQTWVRPGCDNCARRSSQCEYDAILKRRGPDKRPGTRRRSCKKRPAEGEETPAARKRRRTETEDERSDGGDEMIQSSGEPSYHLSTSPVPLMPNSALSIDTEVSRDLFGPTSTGVRRSFPCYFQRC